MADDTKKCQDHQHQRVALEGFGVRQATTVQAAHDDQRVEDPLEKRYQGKVVDRHQESECNAGADADAGGAECTDAQRARSAAHLLRDRQPDLHLAQWRVTECQPGGAQRIVQIDAAVRCRQRTPGTVGAFSYDAFALARNFDVACQPAPTLAPRFSV